MKKLLNYINKIIPKGNYILFHSFTDVSDNSLAMYLYLKKQKKELKKDYKFIWLVENLNKVSVYKNLIRNYGVEELEDTLFFKRISLSGLYMFMRSRYIFCTHGINSFIKMTKNQYSVNLWHGMPLKNIGFLDGKKEHDIYKSNLIISTSEIFRDIMSKAFNSKNVIVSGQPRNEFFFMNHVHDREIEKQNYIVWMPTYRKSNIGDIREEGKIN
ncbi:hypothetical protein FHH43_12325, partial [Clostridium perfringens]|nr:hypothetical protein [Clostridium perfringens]